MSVSEKEIKIINLSCARYDLIKKCKKANEAARLKYEKEIEKINREIEVLLNDGKK